MKPRKRLRTIAGTEAEHAAKRKEETKKRMIKPLTVEQRRRRVEAFRKRITKEARERATSAVCAACIPEDVEIR